MDEVAEVLHLGEDSAFTMHPTPGLIGVLAGVPGNWGFVGLARQTTCYRGLPEASIDACGRPHRRMKFFVTVG